MAKDSMTVKEALSEFYAKNHLGKDAFEKNLNYADFRIIKIPYPNFKKRQQLVYLHDINHVLTGYDTSWIGEGEVAAWELASGFPPHCWVGYLYAPFTFLIGLVLSPKRVLKAFCRGLKEKNSCHAKLDKEQIMSLKVKDLLSTLRIQPC